MDRHEAAARLLRAEKNYRAAQERLDGSKRSVTRYAEAMREIEEAFALAGALLAETAGEPEPPNIAAP